MENVLVIGGAGYVGSQLVPKLINSGRYVRVLDTFWYDENQFYGLDSNKIQLIKGDIRDKDIVKNSIANIDTVIHLACISNDPSFDLNPNLGKSINLDSFRPLVKLINNSNVSKFIYASSSSVYGVKEEEKVTEDLSLDPLTDYSKFKAQCEEILFEEFSPDKIFSIVRPATVCGFSSRQRLDLVVNILTAHAIVNKKIDVHGGSQFRPNLHIDDMTDAYLAMLNVDNNKLNREIFNIGGKNLTVREIAEAVKFEIDPELEILASETDDLRSYRIDSSKFEKIIGFKAERSVGEAIRDLKFKFPFSKENSPLNNPRYINILKMKQLNLG